ncbi:hypothetical protein PTKIN_Ptkin06aG0206200 [Pterospermum kingtungense]
MQIKAVFSKAVVSCSTNFAELLAIREAFMLFDANHWTSSFNLIIESDSSNAVGWVLNPSSGPWNVRSIIFQTEFFKTKIPNWAIIHTRREGNEEADKLAKEGAFSLTSGLHWFYGLVYGS